MSKRLEQLQTLFARNGNDPFLAYGIALEHGKAGQLDDAITWLDRTLAIDGRYAYAYFQKAKMLEQKGDSDAAITTLRTGIAVAKAAGDAHAAEEMMQLLATIE
jgi:tetratricopeptide (TPR) repeat protein